MIDDDIDTFADRDREPPPVVPLEERRRGRAEDRRLPIRTVARLTLADAVSDLAAITRQPIYPTPFDTINQALGLGGLISGYAHILAGGTGKGKTTWALDVAKHHATHHGPVVIVSLEMRAGHLLARSIAGDLGCSANELLRGDRTITVEDVTLPPRLEIVESLSSIDQLTALVEQVIHDYGTPPLLVIDYLQKLAELVMRGMDRPDPRMATTIASDALLSVARRFALPLLVVSAVSRGAGSRIRGGGDQPGRRRDPRTIPAEMFDDVAKESGAVEYDAAALFVLHVSDEIDIDRNQVATMTVAKSRFGRTCHVAAAYDGAGGRWHDRGRVERKVDEPVDAASVSAEIAAERNALQLAVLEVLKTGPMSKSRLAKAMKKRLADVTSAIAPLIRSGQLAESGSGPSSRIALAEPCLPGVSQGPQTPGGGHP